MTTQNPEQMTLTQLHTARTLAVRQVKRMQKELGKQQNWLDTLDREILNKTPLTLAEIEAKIGHRVVIKED